MAARKKTTKPATNVPKAQLIREWFDANPQGTAVECVKALADQGVEVGSAHCQQILSKRKAGKKIDVDTIKLAAEFVSTHGDIDAAISAIDAVGDFIKSCGSPEKAKAALETYQAVAAVLN
ncbi:MAG: hypothetical protein R3C18_27985 [Planctomycetaceae bacterium]